MGERIRINYSIGIEQLASEVARLFDQAKYNLADVSKACELPNSVLSLELVTRIASTRTALYEIDQRLSDVSELVTSYLRHVTAPTPAVPPTSEGDPLSQLENLRDLLGEIEQPERPIDEITD